MQSELPGAYRSVEYLKSIAENGKPYINTGIIPTTNMRIYVEGETSNNVSSAGFIFGSRRDNGSHETSEMFWAITWAGYYCYGLGRKRNGRVVSATPNEQFVIDFNCDYAHVVKFNDVSSENNDGYSSYSQPMYLFGLNTGGNLDGQYADRIVIKRFIVYESYSTSKRIMSLIPCVRRFDNKPGMYDTVSKTFFTNAGTGEFVVPA